MSIATSSGRDRSSSSRVVKESWICAPRMLPLKPLSLNSCVRWMRVKKSRVRQLSATSNESDLGRNDVGEYDTCALKPFVSLHFAGGDARTMWVAAKQAIALLVKIGALAQIEAFDCGYLNVQNSCEN